MKNSDTLVFIPTYNEAENVKLLYQQIKELGLDLDLLFLDDNSPDGTGEILDQISSQDKRVNVIHRKGKEGIGSAHLCGINWAYDQGYKTLITMDCDFTHPPYYIKELLKASEDFSIVVASRFLNSKSLVGWNLLRKTLTHLGHFATKFFLDLPYDATGALRLYKLCEIPREGFDIVKSKGYSFFFESLFILKKNNFKIKEIPINLTPRTYGNSKMDYLQVFKSILLLLQTYATMKVEPERFIIPMPLNDIVNSTKIDTQGWEDYWASQKGRSLYDIVAAIYRKLIIKRALNVFVREYFQKGSSILHAGCGGGQVDKDIREEYSLTALDISVNALSLYDRANKNKCKLLHGSIFEIPLADSSLDGIYNLGVMEHFTEDEIRLIFKEFNRVIKDGGRVIIFWPPKFGLSVIFFKGLAKFLNIFVEEKNMKFHPDELTRLQSFNHAKNLVAGSGFGIIRYYFGPKDLFTQVALVLEKKYPENQINSAGNCVNFI